MTLRLKTRLTLTITTLVLVVLSIVSLFTIITFTREQIRATYDNGVLIRGLTTQELRSELRARMETTSDKTAKSIRSIFKGGQS